ncbi:MAG TPA: hypothetical protein VFQ67_07890 [Allosphingosinicella sp.]|jgi:hypothetical protein|nr:hypothetical protein [Allosphingosinicella sp.]
MGANRLLAAAGLLIAAFGLHGEPAEGRVRSRPKPASSERIPAAFQGVYDSSREACGRASDGRLTVTAGELRFHESIGLVRSVARLPSGALRVEADYQGEGEKWRSRRELRLSGDGRRLGISGDGTSFDRVRCPKGGR